MPIFFFLWSVWGQIAKFKDHHQFFLVSLGPNLPFIEPQIFPVIWYISTLHNVYMQLAHCWYISMSLKRTQSSLLLFIYTTSGDDRQELGNQGGLFSFMYKHCSCFFFVDEMVILGNPRKDTDSPVDGPESPDPPPDEHPELHAQLQLSTGSVVI